MTISGRLPDGPLNSLRLQSALAAERSGTAATTESDWAAKYQGREVEIERRGAKKALAIAGLALGGAGVVGAGAILLRSLQLGGGARPNMPTMVALAATALVGGAVAGGSRILPPRKEHAVAAGFPTLELAQKLDAKLPMYTSIVTCTDGTYAILREPAPRRSRSGGGSRSGGSRPSGGGGYRAPSAPSYNPPRAPSYNPPSYPSTSGSGTTSRGDDSGSSRNSTSNGNPSTDDF